MLDLWCSGEPWKGFREGGGQCKVRGTGLSAKWGNELRTGVALTSSLRGGEKSGSRDICR